MPALSCLGLTRRPWFEGRDLVVGAGDVVFLAGPTGSGKTLLLRAVAGLDALDSGTLRLGERGYEEHRPEEWRRRVLYLHQSAPRLPGTARENVARVADLRAARGREGASADEALALVGLDGAAEAARLSGGEAQLLALARALVTDPDVLLLDEGTTGLDARSAERAEGLLRERVAAGRSLVWVAHDERIAERWDARTVRLA